MRLTKTCGRLLRRQTRLMAALLLGLSGLIAPIPLGQTAAHGQVASPGLPVPGFWDPRRRPERPDLRLTLIRFVSVAAVVFFLVVKPMQALAARRAAGEEPEPAAASDEALLLAEIRDLLANR